MDWPHYVFHPLRQEVFMAEDAAVGCARPTGGPVGGEEKNNEISQSQGPFYVD